LLWDELNVAERNQRLRILARTPGARVRFRLEDAYYFTNIAEAPNTTEFRRALTIIHDYSELLRMLVEGTNVEAARGQIMALIGTLSTLVGNPAISAAAGELSGVLDQLLRVVSLEEAKRLVADGEPAIRQLIASLRLAAPQIYRTLIDDFLATGGADTAKKISAQRVVVANFVVMLDRLEQTFAMLVQAFQRPSNPVTLAALVTMSAQLDSDVKAARQALVVLRRGG
jgi:hypothetical protein